MYTDYKFKRMGERKYEGLERPYTAYPVPKKEQTAENKANFIAGKEKQTLKNIIASEGRVAENVS